MSNIVLNTDVHTRTWNHLSNLETGTTLGLNPGETAETDLPQLYDGNGDPKGWDDPYLAIIDRPDMPSVPPPEEEQPEPELEQPAPEPEPEPEPEAPPETDEAEAPADPQEE